MKTAVNKLRDATKLTLAGTDFGFLTNDDWFTDTSSAANYAMLIGRQDEFMELALNNVQNALDISDGSTDAHIMTQLKSIEDASAEEHMFAIQSAAGIITLWRIQKNTCQTGMTPKIYYNIPMVDGRTVGDIKSPGDSYSLSNIKNKFFLGNLLIRPMLVKNITVLSIANILNTLRKDTYSYQNVIRNQDPSLNFEKAFLVDKYASYIQTVSYQVTNDQPRDFLYMWGCARTGFNKWYRFFIDFIDNLGGVIDDLSNQSPNDTIKHLAVYTSGHTESDDVVMSRFGMLTGIFYKHRTKSRAEILTKFMGDSPILIPSSTAAGGAASAGAATGKPASRQKKDEPTPDDVIGMLPSSQWDSVIDTFTPPRLSAPSPSVPPASEIATATPEPPTPTPPSSIPSGPIQITFGKLLRKLSVEEIHYILHLIHVYKKVAMNDPGQPEQHAAEPAVPTSSSSNPSAGAASGGSGSP